MGGGARRAIAGLVVVVAVGVTGASAHAKGGGTTDSPRWLGARTTADGVRLRVSSASISQTMLPQVINGVEVPADCFPDEMVTVGVSTPKIAESLTSTFRSASGDTTVSAPTTGASTPFPVLDDEPRDAVQVVIVRAPKGAKTVEAKASGWHDEASVRGGYAVLARKAQVRRRPSAPPSRKLVKVTVRDGDGKVIDRASHFFGSNQSFFIDTSREECQPSAPGGTAILAAPAPPTLPDAVGPPPTDEAAAHDAVVAAFEGTYAAGGDPEASLSHVEGGDSPAVRQAQEQTSSANSQYKGRVTASVTEVRFLDATEAAVRYELLLDGEPFLGERIGFAVRTSDGWKVTRSTHCATLAAGGGHC